MGRPPSNGGPSFRFNQAEVAEMEAILHQHNNTMPTRELLMDLAQKFSETAERKGKFQVQMKQVWNWFQNRRYAIRAKSSKVLGKLNVSPMPRVESTPVRTIPQGPQPIAASIHAPSVPSSARVPSENPILEFEAKSGRDAAWYDVANFLSHRSLESGDPDVLVRFAGFGPEEDEWVNVRKHVRQRSLPCESSECVAVLPGDLILCFQEGKEQALYFDANVLDAQRRRHDVRGCRCRFLVRYVHDQSEEIVPLRKVCRRPETDYRLHQLHAENNTTAAEQKSTDHFKVPSTSAEMIQKQHNPVFHVNASVAPQSSTPELRKPEMSIAMSAGNTSGLPGSGGVASGSAPVLTSCTATVISHGGSVGNMPGGN
ncbi:PREDICTED: protein SAWADEE HOMEODOMAIN HOMOLOG 2 [Fragaria vesca subsp. vesca]|uniref:protein SAWADEE HOMEODOMAIN HOMOLOG 2 n=1 Tax=Fragaria vesca subsp. vesca TaxID=101020 RepID=UPI0002C32728|nr:PREDICTED: protein SAWADEE HOMEODOMAIN HOMOLOG 2 [Fragaria vesca subsp. vesca]